jgi:hypothetical protein
MGMFDNIKVKSPLPIPKEVSSLEINWSDYEFQTKDLDNCLLDFFISEEGSLFEKVVEREYVPFSEEEKKNKKYKKWNIWKEVIEKNSYNKKIEGFHGKINFYTYEVLNKENDFWLEFTAYFSYGKLDKIELSKFDITESNSKNNEKLKLEYEKKQRHPWNIFKKYANYIGWSFFWREIGKFLLFISKSFKNFSDFIFFKIV